MHQAFILGAGLGTRLAPLTSILPKPLMPVLEKPLIQHTMDHFLRAGIREFIINTSVLEFAWDRYFPGPDARYGGAPVTFSHEPDPLDSGGGIKKILPLVNPTEPLLVHNGDILTDFPVHDLLAEHTKRGNLVTLSLRSVDGKRNVGFDPDSGCVTDMRHALGIDPGQYQFAGTYIMQPEVAQLFPQNENCFSIVPIWLNLIKQGRVGGVVADWADWHELGTPSSYLDTVLSRPSSKRIHASASVSPLAELSEDCAVGQDAVIPAGAVLDDCIVWPRTHVAPGSYSRCILTPRLTVPC